MADHHILRHQPRSTDEHESRYPRHSQHAATGHATTTTTTSKHPVAATSLSSVASSPSSRRHSHHYHSHSHSHSPSPSHSQSRHSGSSQYSGSALSDIYAHPYRSSDSFPLHHYDDDNENENDDYYYDYNNDNNHTINNNNSNNNNIDEQEYHHHPHTTSLVQDHSAAADDDDETYILPSKAYVPPPRPPSLSSPLKRNREVSSRGPSHLSHEVNSPGRPSSLYAGGEDGQQQQQQTQGRGEEENREQEREGQRQVLDHSKPSHLLIPNPLPAAPATSWLLDASASPTIVPRDLDRFPRGSSPNLHPSLAEGSPEHEPDDPSPPHLYQKTSYQEDSFLNVSQQDHSRPRTEQSFASFHTAQNSIGGNNSDSNSTFEEEEDEDEGVVGDVEPSSPTHAKAPASSSQEATPIVTDSNRPTMSPKVTPLPAAQNLTLKIGGSIDPSLLNDLNDLSALEAKRPVSPVAKISSFFGWRSAPKPIDSPTTPMSENRSMSFEHSPAGPSGMDPSRRPSQAEPRSPYSSGTSYSIPGDHVDELIQELREVSTELAASIRREMELEDELDRYKTDMPTGPPTAMEQHTRRTSDYYSDSGASSVKMLGNESTGLTLTETKIEGLEKMRRKVEQEKAQLRLDMTEKVQEDLNQRRALEMHVQSLEERLQSHGAAPDRRELEVSLEDTRRRLNEERQFKQNFEDLLGGMREELEGLRNERDNLRDEVVPQLKSRLEGVEADALEKHNLTYENARMQQEMQSLKNENQTLANARRMAIDMQGGGRQRSGSASKGGYGPAGEDNFKDMEDQRDALHKTLKSLVVRQDNLTKHHAKHIRVLEVERDRALATASPRRGSSNPEAQRLRSEANELRARADDAMEEKWQCEKGLSGLKMDLDRAKQETASLRDLLQEDDIFTHSRPSTPNGGSSRGSPDRSAAATESLEKLYAELKTTGNTSPAATNLLPQVQKQLERNQQFRKKLAVAIERGVREQASSEDRINEMQSALRKAEEDVLASQQVTEDAISQQEGHAREIREAKTEKELRGVRGTTKRVPAIYSGKPGEFKAGQRTSIVAGTSPTDALFALRSPKLDQTTSGAGISITQASNMKALEKNIKELEREANRADKEMQGVIEMMNRAQLEVSELQAERDESTKETRRIQREIIAAKQGTKASR